MPERRDHPLVYETVRRWLDVVAENGALFLPVARVWTRENIDALYSAIVDYPDTGGRNFHEKLDDQARSIGPVAQRLAAEALFVVHLRDGSTLPATKRRQVDTLLTEVVPPVEVPAELGEVVKYGMARPGAGLARLLQDYLFVLRFARHWAQASAAERRRLLEDPWAFRDVLTSLFEKGSVFAREALKHLVHPETFEPIGSLKHKRWILRALDGVTPRRNADLDKELQSLRERREQNGETEEGFSFYDPGVRPTWDPGMSSPVPEEDDEPVNGAMEPPKHPSPLRRSDVQAAVEDEGLRLPFRVVTSLVAALNAGKHVVLTGAPGTAKTTLAQIAAEQARLVGRCRGHVVATATADWSTYETVGGYRPRSDGSLEFAPGVVLQAIRDHRWLVLDEMNRANTDRALGALFTVLAGQEVTLPAEQKEQPVRIRPAVDDPRRPDDSTVADYEVPPGWRIIATTNVLDRSLLFDLSFALMRRCAFVDVSCPPLADYEALVHDAVADLSSEQVRSRVTTLVTSLLPLTDVRPLGPALFIDAAHYVAAYLTERPDAPSHEVVLDAFFAYLLPQFEGADESEATVLRRHLVTVAGRRATGEITAMLHQALGITFLDRSAPTDGENDEEIDLDDQP